MSFSNQVVGQIYTGDGSNKDFVIPFYFVPGTANDVVKVYSIDPLTGARTVMSGYTLVPNLPLIAPVPTTVQFATAPAAGVLVLVIRESELKQATSFSNTGDFPAKTHEKTYDKIVSMIQEVNQRASGSTFLNYGLDTSIPPLMGNAGKALVVNDDEDALRWSSAAAGGLPDPAGTNTLLESDGTDFLETAPVAYDGISALTGAPFTSNGIIDTLNKIIRITYTPPLLSLAGAGSGTLRERGDPVVNPLLTATVTKKSDPVASLAFYDTTISAPNQIGSDHVGDPPVPNGGVDTQATVVSFSTNRTFRARVIDSGATGGPTNVDASVSYSFVYPYYRGAGASGLTAAQVALLTKEIINNTATRTLLSFSVTAGQKIYFAYPAAYASLTSILDVNGFETIADWTLTTANITGLDGNAVSYKIYSQNSVIGVTGTYQFTFKQ